MKKNLLSLTTKSLGQIGVSFLKYGTFEMVRYFQKRHSLTDFFLGTQNSKISRFKAKCHNFKVN